MSGSGVAFGPGLSSSFSSFGPRTGRPGGSGWFGRTAFVWEWFKFRPTAAGQTVVRSNRHVAQRDDDSNTHARLASWPSVLLDVAWWDDVMLAILRRESSIHARTFYGWFFDRSGAIQRCFRCRPESVFSEMSFFQKGNAVHSFCLLCVCLYAKSSLVRTIFDYFQIVTFSVHDVNNEMLSGFFFQSVTKQ